MLIRLLSSLATVVKQADLTKGYQTVAANSTSEVEVSKACVLVSRDLIVP